MFRKIIQKKKVELILLLCIAFFSVIKIQQAYADDFTGSDPFPSVTSIQLNNSDPQSVVQAAEWNANKAAEYAAQANDAASRDTTTGQGHTDIVQAATNAQGYANQALQHANNAAGYAAKTPPDLQGAQSELVYAQTAAGNAQYQLSVAQGQATQNKNTADANKSCISFTSFNPGVCIKTLGAWIAYISLVVMSWFVGVTGLLFNEIIKFGVINMKANVDGIPAINIGWKVLRDLGNMAFIFILLYVAIKTMLGLADGNTKRLIRNIIIVGLLVNFSLFFTKFLIDVSNVLSIGFYNAIVGPTVTLTGISERFTSPLGIAKLDDPNAFTTHMVGQDYTQIIITGLGGSVFLIFLAFTFLYASVLFILRFVILVFLMLLSPIAYFGFILPETQSYAKKWWDTLRAQLIFAPLYMMLIYLVLILAHGLTATLGNDLIDGLVPQAGAVKQSGSAVMASVLNYVLVIFFLNAATVVATSVATSSGGIAGKVMARGSKFADSVRTKVTSTATRTAGAATAGTAGFVGRNVAGRIGSKIASEDSILGQKMRRGALAAGDGTPSGYVKAFATRQIAKAGLGLSRGAANASFDARSTSAVQAMAKTAGVDIGKGTGKGGYEEKLKKQKESMKAYLNKYGSGSVKTMDTIRKQRAAVASGQEELELATNPAEKAIALKKITDAKKVLKDAKKDKVREVKGQRTKLMTQFGTTVSPSAVLAGAATGAGLAAITGNPLIVAGAAYRGGKAGYKPARKYKEALTEYMESQGADTKETDEEEFKDQKEQLETLQEMHEKNPSETVSQTISEIAKNVKASNVGKLNSSILKNQAFIKEMTSVKLKKIEEEGKLTPAEHEEIAKVILGDTTHKAHKFVKNVKKDSAWHIDDNTKKVIVAKAEADAAKKAAAEEAATTPAGGTTASGNTPSSDPHLDSSYWSG